MQVDVEWFRSVGLQEVQGFEGFKDSEGVQQFKGLNEEIQQTQKKVRGPEGD